MRASEIREILEKILVKWHMPTRQAAISEIMRFMEDPVKYKNEKNV